MSITNEPYLLHRVDAKQLEDAQTVHVAGHFEQRHHDPEPEAQPKPHHLAALIDWLIVTGCLITIAVVSVPELRAAVAGLF